ncbi:MAG: 3-hydroxybutyrate oligomer hydrolase family protein, partial [Pseudomonadota bacterium]
AETERRAPTPLRYYEVERGQHFETLLMLPGFPQSSAPLTPHTFEALSLMRAHIQRGEALPPSQVIRTKAPSGDGGMLMSEDMGEIRAAPLDDEINFNGGVLRVPG